MQRAEPAQQGAPAAGILNEAGNEDFSKDFSEALQRGLQRPRLVVVGLPVKVGSTACL
jgi:hypothetical protein